MRNTEKPSTGIKLDWITLVAVIVCVGFFWGGTWVIRRMDAIDKENRDKSKRREEAIARFSPFLRQYSMLPTIDETRIRFAYVKGKAVAVGLGEYKVDWKRDTSFGGARLTSFDHVSWEKLEHPQPFIDGLYFELPESIRAKSPEEVQTRILVEWQRDVVGWYQLRFANGKDPAGHPEAHQFKCVLTITDDTRGAIVERKVFTGDEPAKTITQTSGETFGRLPLEEIVRFVADLPRR